MDLVGLEPTTSRLQGECSPKDELEARELGGAGENRTLGLALAMRALSHLSYCPENVPGISPRRIGVGDGI